MKTVFKPILTVIFCIGFTGIALGAPTFDIDFYGGDTGLVQGVYDTGEDIRLSEGQSVAVQILISGLETDNGLAGWSLRLNYGEALQSANLLRDNELWPNSLRRPDIGDGYLTIEGMADMGTGVEGDDVLLFSFDLTALEGAAASAITLWDFDMGGAADDVQTLQGDTLDGNQLPVDLATVNSVPIPAGVWLFGSGIVTLITMRRKSQR